MATGALDSNGVWQYGEDDARDTFSELLNIGQDSISDAIAADRARLDALEAAGTLSTLSTGIATASSGWSIQSQTGRKKNGIAFIYIRFERTGSAITVPSDGNVGPSVMGTLNSGWQRASGLLVHALKHSGEVGPLVSGYINSSNELTLGAVAPGATLGTGVVLGFGAEYPLA